MNDVMVIEGMEIERIEYQGQPVLSLPMVAQLHRKETKLVWQNFKRNISKFTEGVDFYDLPQSLWSGFWYPQKEDTKGVKDDTKKGHKGHKGSMIFLSLRGYMKVATTFTDDLSWKIRDMLIDSYFNLRELQAIAKDLIALKAKADEAETWKDKYLHMHEEVYQIFKQKLIKKPPLTRDEIERIKQMYAEGYSAREIGRAVERTGSTIYHVLANELSEDEMKNYKKIRGKDWGKKKD